MALPFLTVSNNGDELRTQLQANMTAINDALSIRLIARVVPVERYSATGATTTKIKLPTRRYFTAYAVLLVKASLTGDPGADLAVTGRPNFTQPDGSTLLVCEPSGLTANNLYDLTFLVLETEG